MYYFSSELLKGVCGVLIVWFCWTEGDAGFVAVDISSLQ